MSGIIPITTRHGATHDVPARDGLPLMEILFDCAVDRQPNSRLSCQLLYEGIDHDIGVTVAPEGVRRTLRRSHV